MIKEVYIEKYRPQKLDEMIGIDKELFKTLISNPSKLPNILLYSPQPGTGKSSLAKVLIKELGAESLQLNASDERSIDVVRNKIKRFVETCSINPDTPKIVLLDEVDGMKGKGDDTQEALRGIMENKKTKFILTCNDVNDVIEPIQSRCSLKINMQLPNKDEIYKHLLFICEKENIKITEEALEEIVKLYYPSIRNMLNYLYTLSLKGLNNVNLKDIEKLKGIYENLYNKVKSGLLLDARKEWLEFNYPLRDVLKYFFISIIKEGPVTIEQIIKLITETDYRFSVHVDNDINMFNFIIEFYKLISED